MRTATRTISPLLAAGTVLSLTACTVGTLDPAGSSQEPTADTTPSPSASPSATASAEQPDTDTLLSIETVAATADGAQLDLALRVQRSLPADDPAAADLRSLLLDACGDGFLSDEQLDSEGWGLLRVEVTATDSGSIPWPEDEPLSLVTAGEEGTGSAALAASGDPLTVPPDPAGESGPCLVPRSIAAEGDAYFVLGIRYDFESPDAQGLFWNGFRYGVASGVEAIGAASSGVTLDECTIVKTPLGEELAAPEVGYTETIDDTECSAGDPPNN